MPPVLLLSHSHCTFLPYALVQVCLHPGLVTSYGAEDSFQMFHSVFECLEVLVAVRHSHLPEICECSEGVKHCMGFLCLCIFIVKFDWISFSRPITSELLFIEFHAASPVTLSIMAGVH